MKREWRLVALLGILAVAFPLACKKNAPTTTASVQPAKTVRPAESVVAPPAAPATATDAQAAVLSQDLAALNRKGYLVDAFFDFQKTELREDARAALARDAQWLNKFPSVEILLEGHCDDRGTDAYNLALGAERAAAVRGYLISLGIGDSRIRTISYGKERPFCSEDDERCWQDNRRAHVLVTAK
jgi:peptidoglycan-associated lipoprotein